MKGTRNSEIVLQTGRIGKSQVMGAFVAGERASAYPVRLAVRYGCFINPGTNALLALQGQCAGHSAVSVSDLLRNPNGGNIVLLPKQGIIKSIIYGQALVS
jgi:hypothetical protein